MTEEIYEDKGKNQGLNIEPIKKVDLVDLLELLNLVVSSTKIKTIRIHLPSNTNPIREITGNLSLGIFGRYSSFKSSILEQVEKHGNAILIHSVTAPSLVGSIDSKRSVPVIPLVWESRGKTLIIDEFQSNRMEKKRVIEALLSILQDHRYEKTFAITTKHTINFEDGDQYCRIQDGKVSIKVNLSLVIASMKPLDSFLRWPTQIAFISRLIPVIYEPTEEEVDKLVNGFLDLTIKEYPVEETVDISVKEYQEIQDWLKFYGYTSTKLPTYSRLLECLVRVRAIKGYFDQHIAKVIADMYLNVEEMVKMIDECREDHKRVSIYGDLR
jgi:hypothetical protein